MTRPLDRALAKLEPEELLRRVLLEEQGATVVITRTSNDVMLTNIDRAKMLNAANVDVALQLQLMH